MMHNKQPSSSLIACYSIWAFVLWGRTFYSLFTLSRVRTQSLAILSYVTVTSSTTPVSPGPRTPPTTTQQPTKILLRNNDSRQGSEGVALSRPPTTSKLRKYWGGEEDDPLQSHDYIWNKDFVGRFKRLIQPGHDDSLVQKSAVKEKPSGFLSLNRVMTLDSLDADLSKELTIPTMATLQESIASPTEKNSSSPKWRPAPTRREQEKWDRATKTATGGGEVMFRELRRPRGDPIILAAESREQYFKLKNKLQILTTGIGSIGLVSAYISSSPEIAVSFGAGLLSSLIYIRMLGSSVVSLVDGAKGLIKGAIGQPRLLVPVVLVMIYNRWNGILVLEYGALHLELVPMLIGFFTYKVSTFAQAIEDALSGFSRKTHP